MGLTYIRVMVLHDYISHLYICIQRTHYRYHPGKIALNNKQTKSSNMLVQESIP